MNKSFWKKQLDPITIIKPSRKFNLKNLKEIYQYRELFWTFIVRDIKVRYKQTIIGGLWAILQPFFTMIVFSFFFGKIAKMPSEGVAYPLFSYTGLVLWVYFTNAINAASNSMVGSAGLITKVYFPRIIIPLASTLVGILDYTIALLIVFALMVYYQVSLNPYLVFLPFIVFFTAMLASGIGFWLSAINVKFRDVRFVLPFFIQLLVFFAPVIYPFSVAGNYKWVVMLNPVSGFIEAHRTLLLGHQPMNFTILGISILSTFVIFISGIFYFSSVERYFADIV